MFFYIYDDDGDDDDGDDDYDDDDDDDDDDDGDDGDLRALARVTCSTMSRYYILSGLTPEQRVFGLSHRLQASLLSDDHWGPAILSLRLEVEF